MHRAIRRIGIGAALVAAAGPVYGYVGSGCAIWGGFMADAAGTIHRHDRANPAIGGAVTCF